MKNHLARTHLDVIRCEQLPKVIENYFLRFYKRRTYIGLFRPPEIEVTSQSGSVNSKIGPLHSFV